MRNLVLAALLGLSVLACKKDENNNNNNNTQPQFGKAILEFEHKWGSSPFTIPTAQPVTNIGGEALNFSMFNYYISNIEWIAVDGSVYSVPESYHLFKLGSQSTLELELENIPAKTYSGMRFTIGVDSTRNVSGAQEGALSPAEGMFWSWNSGYIFLKTEGQSNGTDFAYHIGGFRNANKTNALQEVSYLFPLPLQITSTATPELHQMVHVEKMFDGPGMELRVSQNPRVTMPGMNAVNISKNYVEMFELEHIHN